MDADLDLLLTTVFCTADDLLPDRQANAARRVTNAEVVTFCKSMIEPVFGNTKFNRGIDRFQRRGRRAVRSEWRLITATHNVMKLHTHQVAIAAP